MLDIQYKKDKLTIECTEEGWEVWKMICLIKGLHNIRWETQFTDRDRGFIEEVYGRMKDAGVDFSDEQFNAILKKHHLVIKDSLTEATKKLDEVIKRLEKLEPTVIIRYEKDEKTSE